MRQTAHSRTDSAGGDGSSSAGDSFLRQPAARPPVSALRLIVAPFVAIAAALAGLVFVVLLPICGIASIAEAVAQGSWRFLRDSFGREPHPPARRI